MDLLKIEKRPAVARLAPEHIEKNETASALKDASYAYEMQILDLQNEFAHRGAKIRDDYLSKVAAITAGE
jgi:hypothetical protein